MKTKIESLAVFSAIKDDPVVLALHKLLDELNESAETEEARELHVSSSSF